MKYNLKKVMLQVGKIYRKEKEISFAEALHRAWLSAKAEEINAKRIQEAQRPQRELWRCRIRGTAGSIWAMKWCMGARHCLVLI